MNTVYKLPDWRLDDVSAKIDRLNPRKQHARAGRVAAKLGCAPIVVTQTGESFERVDGSEGHVRFVHLTLTGESPRLAGWSFVSRLDTARRRYGRRSLHDTERIMPRIIAMLRDRSSGAGAPLLQRLRRELSRTARRCSTRAIACRDCGHGANKKRGLVKAPSQTQRLAAANAPEVTRATT